MALLDAAASLRCRYQRGLRAWLEKVNIELEPLGLYAKAQTMIEPRDHFRVERSVLSFALTEEEAERLRREPVLVVPDCWSRCEACTICPMDDGRVV